MAKKVGYDGLSKLKVGHEVMYIAGKGSSYCEAKATVAKTPGTTNCFIRILEYTHKGESVDHNVGDEILAGAGELFLTLVITTKKVKPSGTILMVNGKFAGLVSQSPNHPDVMNPGKWSASIHTADDGLVVLGHVDTEKEAVDAAIDGLAKNLTYAQWAVQA